MPKVQANELLEAGLAELEGLHGAPRATPRQRDQLLALAALLETWAARLNLTAHRSVDAILRRLVLDAAALAAVAPPFSSLVDLGAGAGFPGLPIAVLRPERSITLVESRLRRHHFQRAAARELGLANVRLERGRAEEIAPTPHDAVIAQAMAQPRQALTWMLPWVRESGWILLPRSGDAPPDDLSALPEGVVFDHETPYAVPCGGPARKLWVGRLTGH